MFTSKVNELFQALGTNQIMVLATCADSKVTARSMSFIIDKFKLFFQTDRSFCKYSQMKSNPNVAICLNNIQIEGICREIGHPLSQNNVMFAQKYKEHFRGSFEKYSHLPNETVFEVTPGMITVWSYEDGKPVREFYNFNKEKYNKEYV